MFRLIALSLQKSVNTAIPVFVAVFFVLYAFWFITTKILKLPEKRAVQLVLTTAVAVLVLLCIDKLLRNHSFLSVFKVLVELTPRLLTDTASLGNFFSLANKYISVIIVSLIGTVTIGLCLFVLPDRILRVNWQSLFADNRPGRTPKTTLVVIVLLAIINLCIVVDRMIIEPKGPNIILISIDTLRPDRLGCYGYARDTSPNINRYVLYA